MEEEENQREIKRIKEKEKREANEALMHELSEWENEIFSKKVLTELKSMWEVRLRVEIWIGWASKLVLRSFQNFTHGPLWYCYRKI